MSLSGSAQDGIVTLQCESASINVAEVFRQLSADWLTTALRAQYPAIAVERCKISKIVVGCSAKVWVELEFDDRGKAAGLPSSLIVKSGFHDFDPLMLFSYEMEMLAYRHIRPTFPMNAPRCFYAGQGPNGIPTIIIEDLLPAKPRFCHALSPLSYQEAASFLEALARFHAHSWTHPSLCDGSSEWASEIARVFRRAETAMLELMSPQSWAAYLARPRGAAMPMLLRNRDFFMQAFARLQEFISTQHQIVLVGDAHLGNMYMGANGTPGFLDLAARIGPWHQEVAYFLGSALDALDRRQWERPLLKHYLKQLMVYGIDPPPFEEAWDAYVKELLLGYFVWLTNGPHFQTEAVNTANAVRFAVAVIENDTFGRLGVKLPRQAAPLG
jgi:hypothetical protein